MNIVLTASFFRNNRAALRASSAHSLPIVIASNGHVQRTADSTLPFAQDSNFWYLTGLNTPDSLLVITEHEDYLIVPSRSKTRETFDGAIDIDSISQRSGIDKVFGEEGWAILRQEIDKCQRYGTAPAPDSYIKSYGMHTNPSKKRLLAKIHRLCPDAKQVDIRPALTKLRSIKQPEEIACMRAATSITKAAMADIEASDAFSKMRYEYELEAAVTCSFRTNGASGHAYAPIVASGKNATTLHYVDNNSSINPSDLIVLDVGAEVEHYAADITRTICQTSPSPRQQAVFDAVQEVQRSLFELLKPGVSLVTIESAAERMIGEHLRSLGLITNPADDDAVRTYYPHSFSHFLGLDVHDVGDYRAVLQPGMVVTCEPGIYIPAEAIGVRIEDDVLITDTGNEVL